MMTENVRTLQTLEIVGGALCLDFVNTINSRLMPEHDYLANYSDLVAWANKVEILSPTQKNLLLRRAKQHVADSEKSLLAARALRDLLYRLFSNAAKGFEPTRNDMISFVRSYGESITHGQLIKKGKSYITTWKVEETFDAFLWPIVHSAGELLLSDDLGQVNECPGCGWLFLDTSKNQSRRWCSMNTCGARDKMRRYHKRKQAK